jgi:DNA-binding LytR/AlgR family response regulator
MTGRAPTDGRKLKAVIADDEPRARQFLARLLSEHDEIELVGEAKSGGETLALVSRLSPEVVFLDIQMPDLSGLEVARHLTGEDAPVVVFVTAFDQHAVEAFEVAALDYLLKPIRRERLAEAMRRVVQEIRSGKRGARQEAAVRSVLASPEVRQFVGKAQKDSHLRRPYLVKLLKCSFVELRTRTEQHKCNAPFEHRPDNLEDQVEAFLVRQSRYTADQRHSKMFWKIEGAKEVQLARFFSCQVVG